MAKNYIQITKNILILSMLRDNLKLALKNVKNFENFFGSEVVLKIQTLGSLHLEWLEIVLDFLDPQSKKMGKITFSNCKEVEELNKLLHKINPSENPEAHKALFNVLIIFYKSKEFIIDIRKYDQDN